MRTVLAPDKFKGSLTARQVAAAMAAGIRSIDRAIEIDESPMADGGEGTVDVLVNASGGRFVIRRVTGPLPEMKVDATFGILGDNETAVIEMAAASGLQLLTSQQYDPMRATTRGTGELLVEAAKHGAKRIILGIGGSASVDGGVGCVEAAGSLKGKGIEIMVGCDVSNPLLGDHGAARVFGPQKGATPEQVEQLEARLSSLAQKLGAQHLTQIPGTGAAGGLGFGMLAFFGASLRSGIDIVIEMTRLRNRLDGAHLCLTGEGRLDSQTASGKVVAGVALLCQSMNIRCIAIVGSTASAAADASQFGVTSVVELVSADVNLDRAMCDAPELIASAARRIVAHEHAS